jgi:hypothetical protein
MITTYLLNTGIVVLAKRTALGIRPVTYSSFEKAEKKAEELTADGVNAYVIGYGNPAKYIALTVASKKAHAARELGRKAHAAGKPHRPGPSS